MSDNLILDLSRLTYLWNQLTWYQQNWLLHIAISLHRTWTDRLAMRLQPYIIGAAWE